jgi:glycosyltransferase involved in cell wall biosynthesis
MTVPFEQDAYPRKPKILFIGLAQSTHTHAWVELLSGASVNARLFAVPNGPPPDDWPVKTYVSGLFFGSNSGIRRYRYPGLLGGGRVVIGKLLRRAGRPPLGSDAWLAGVIRKWKPDVVHTLGLFDDQGGTFYLDARRRYGLDRIGKWVCQLRGGSDVALRRFHPKEREILLGALRGCDRIVCDNRENIRYAVELGIPESKFAPFVPVPGSGGVDIRALSRGTVAPSKRRRVIVWPKAYESPWSKALPVLEAVRNAWDSIRPCELHLLAATPEVVNWWLSLPEEIRSQSRVRERIPRGEVLSLLQNARVMLAPSLIDGVPNSLYEAMACGAFPIVSPLASIASAVAEEDNVLFARNMYPGEIARALTRAMQDDGLVDSAAVNNRALVERLADRDAIRPRVVRFYESLAAAG